MTTYTELHLTATPGTRHSFLAKGVIPIGDHVGLFTILSVSATPGIRRSFVAKSPAVPVGHVGLFTGLSVSATPGIRYSFLAKEESDVIIIPVIPSTSIVIQAGMAGVADNFYREDRSLTKQLREDEELTLIISTLVGSGVLD